MECAKITNVEKERGYILNLISAVTSVIFYVCLQSPFAQERLSGFVAKTGMTYDMFGYAAVIIVFAVLSLLFYVLFRKKSFILALNHKVSMFIFIVILSILAALAILLAIGEQESALLLGYVLFWHQIPRGLLAVVLLLLFFAYWCMLRKLNDWDVQAQKKFDYVFWCIALAGAILVGYLWYYGQPFLDPHHHGAYYTSVYNVFYGEPYSETFTSIYGHYALFYAPFLKLAAALGITDILGIFHFLVSCLLICTVLLAAFALHVFIKNRFVKYTGIVALMFTLITWKPMPYIANDPHRILPLAVTMAMIAVCIKYAARIPRWGRLAGYGICSLLILWNAETGLVSLAAWTAFMAVYSHSAAGSRKTAFWKAIAFHVVMAIVSFVLAVLIADLYNLAVGGRPLSLGQFLIPLGNDGYMNGVLPMQTPSILGPWGLAFVLFLLMIGRGIHGVLGKNGKQYAAYLGFGILGLGYMTYYMNRSAYYNLGVVYSMILLALCITAQTGIPYWNKFKAGIKQKASSLPAVLASGVGIASMFLIFVLAMGTFAGAGLTIINSARFRDSQPALEIANEISKNIPPDTKAIGNGTAEIYSILGWDTRVHLVDSSSVAISDEWLDSYTTALLGDARESVLLSGEVISVLSESRPEKWAQFTTEYSLVYEYPANEATSTSFSYFVPN